MLNIIFSIYSTIIIVIINVIIWEEIFSIIVAYVFLKL